MKKEKKNHFTIALDSDMLAFLSDRSSPYNREKALMDLIARRVSSPTKVVKNDCSLTLQPGEADVSIHSLAHEWNWDRKTVRKFLDTLSKMGIITIRREIFASVAVFPTLIDSTASETVQSTTLPAKDSPPLVPEPSTTEEAVPQDHLDPMYEVSIRYDGSPLVIKEEVREKLRRVYDLFRNRLPLLEAPEYNDRTEKAIFSTFILGMKGDEELLKRFLDTVAKDSNLNGELAEMTGDDEDKESFSSLFSSRWQELLFPPSR